MFTPQALKDLLDEKKIENRRYSLRAFSRDLGISHSLLCQILNGKRRVSKTTEHKIQKNIQGGRSPEPNRLTPQPHAYFTVNQDQIKAISTWYYFTILSLIKTPHFIADAGWVSKTLEIPQKTVEEAFQTLYQLKFIKMENGKISVTKDNVRSSYDIPEKSIRDGHLQVLDLAKQHLTGKHAEEVKSREFSSQSLAIDPKNISRAKVLIRKFRHELAALLEEGNPKQLYRFNIQLFPTTEVFSHEENE